MDLVSRVLGVLGGNDNHGEVLSAWAERATTIIAADSGADTVIAHGFMPDWIIGDLDSMLTARESVADRLICIEDQSSSDCDKLLRWVEEQGHQNLVLTGVEGDRLDHVLASLSSCLRSPLQIRLAIRDGVADFVSSASTLRQPIGTRLSIMPLTECVGVTISGVRWPISEADLNLGGLLSLSNVSTEDVVDIRLASGSLLVTRSIQGRFGMHWPFEDTV